MKQTIGKAISPDSLTLALYPINESMTVYANQIESRYEGYVFHEGIRYDIRIYVKDEKIQYVETLVVDSIYHGKYLWGDDQIFGKLIASEEGALTLGNSVGNKITLIELGKAERYLQKSNDKDVFGSPRISSYGICIKKVMHDISGVILPDSYSLNLSKVGGVVLEHTLTDYSGNGFELEDDEGNITYTEALQHLYLGNFEYKDVDFVVGIYINPLENLSYGYISEGGRIGWGKITADDDYSYTGALSLLEERWKERIESYILI